TESQEEVDVVGEIAHRRYAVGDVEQAVGGAEVDVHVPQAGDHSFAGGVDHCGTRRRGEGNADGDAFDAVAVHEDCRVGRDLQRGRIEEARVLDDEHAARLVRETPRGDRKS